MPEIKDKFGNTKMIKAKIEDVSGIKVVITKWRPDGTKSTRFYLAYEANTGHWCGIGKTKEDAKQYVIDREETIKRLLEQQNIGIGGLFG